MITIKTLPDATAQEVFNKVYNHLMTQRTKSMTNEKLCAYRGEEGLMCAAGCLIGDDEYTPDMEGKSWGSMVEDFGLTRVHESLINRLQIVHDCHIVENWESKLEQVADDFDLKVPCDGGG